MKIIHYLVILLLVTPLSYAAEADSKGHAAAASGSISSDEQAKANVVLIKAIRERDLAGVETVLKKGADIMAYMETLPPLASDKERPMSILAYINKGMYYERSFEYDVLELFFTYNRLNKHNLNAFMHTDILPNPGSTDDETTPFQMCVLSEAFDLIKKGIEHGADVNKPVQGLTPLMLLANVGYMKPNTPERESTRQHITELLIQHKASMSPIDSEDDPHTALDFAILNHSVGMIRVLLHYKAPFDARRALIHVVTAKRADVVDMLLAYGVDPNKVDDRFLGATPLIRACTQVGDKKLNPTIIQHLLAAGADPLMEDKKGHDATWHLMHYEKNDNGRVVVADTTPSPERDQAIKLINTAIAQRVAEVEHPLFSSGIPELVGSYLSGPMAGKQEAEEPEEVEPESVWKDL